MEAEAVMIEKLERMMMALSSSTPGLEMSLKSFANADATVDGELRIVNLPDKWRTVDGLPGLMGVLSKAIDTMGAFPEAPSMGGAFWISFGLRFGPKDRQEIEAMAKFYKRFRGLFQVGAYHSTAQQLPAIRNNALAIRYLIERVWARRELPPAQLLVRVVWTPDTKHPGRYAGEEGVDER